jgi:hypothetical protein
MNIQAYRDIDNWNQHKRRGHMLSQQAIDICESNYDFIDKKKPGCGICLIRSACVDKATIRTQEDLNNHIQRINKLAKEVSI